MRTPSQIQTELRNLLNLLLHVDIALVVNPVVTRYITSSRSRITWAPSQVGSGPVFSSIFCSIDEYEGWIRGQAYSAVLYDGALLQLSYDFAGDDLTGHRLLYYPCPFDVDQDLLREEYLPDVIGLYRGQMDSQARLRSPLRFDYDEQAQAHGHPASHLTLVSEECRWAVVAPLSPGHFIKFVFRHFYPSLWSELDVIRSWPQELADRTITPEEERLLHIACAR